MQHTLRWKRGTSSLKLELRPARTQHVCVGFELSAWWQGLNAQELADSVAVGRVAELTEHSI
jgi:hypothetical protein